MRYAVVLEKSANNYSVYVPDLPGCITVGDTREEALAHIREAIELHVEGMARDGDDIPSAETLVDYVDVTIPALVKK